MACGTLDDVGRVASQDVAAFIEEWYNDNDFVIGHTSGSTGKPKEIKLRKSDMRHSAEMTNRFFSLTSDSRMLLCLSPSYIAGKMMLVRAIVSGADIYEEKPSNNPLSEYSGVAFDFAAMVPSQAKVVVENPERLRYIKKLIIGGGAVSADLRKAIVENQIEAYSTYGMTETCSHVAISKIEIQVNPFCALPSTTFEIDNRNCLIINSPRFSFRKLVTNDVVDLLSPTEFYWKGRYDNVINTGGIKVFPEDIEKKIANLIDVRFYISSRESKKWGNEVVLILERKEMEMCDRQKLMSLMKKCLPAFSVPKEIICIPQFKETSSGKVLRNSHVN